jgi:methyl-accepting chemotaxis protein
MSFHVALNKIKLSHKLFIVVTALNLLTISTFTYFAYSNQKETILRGIDSKLIASGQGIKVALDSFHQKLRNSGGIPADEYRKELDALSAFADKAGIKYAYSVMLKDGGVVFTSSSYTREELEKGDLTSLYEPYKDAPEGLKTALQKNEIVYDQYTDRWGSFRSVFIPSHLPHGESYVIGIDVALDEISLILRQTLVSCLLIGFFVFVSGTIVALLVARYISKSVRRIAQHLNQVADGDLGVLIEKKSNDELGMLSQDINRMVEKLRMLISSVKNASDSVVSASGQFYATSRNLAIGVEEVAGQAVLVATAAEEMAATSRSISDNCTTAAQSVKVTEDFAQTAEGVVRQTVAMMDSIAALVQDSAVTVKDLGTSSAQIGSIIATIEDIADQTNLLALNAAIEAARAGEQGRGFAVVADEVRRLADRTGKATREIGMVIKTIQAKIGDAVNSMQEGVTQVTTGTTDAARSGEALQEIVKHARLITTQVNQVAMAATEQTTTTDEISCNISQITTIAQSTVDEVKNSVTAAGQMSSLAEDLHNQIQQFKLPG